MKFKQDVKGSPYKGLTSYSTCSTLKILSFIIINFQGLAVIALEGG